MQPYPDELQIEARFFKKETINMIGNTNKLSIIIDRDDHYGDALTLSIDGIPLHKYFEECMDDDIHDSVALPWKDPHDLSGLTLLWDYPFYWKGNERFVWFLTDSSENEVVPILSCSDDADEMDCLLLCAYVRKDEKYVYWDRIGRIIHEYHEWEKMKAYGYTCGEILSKEKAEQYGYNTSIYDIEDDDAWNWIKDHWDDELYRRNIKYLLTRYRSEKAVKWLKDTNWKFPRNMYENILACFRKGELCSKLCICIDPPKDSLFEKETIYRWEYGIDCYRAYHESGAIWTSSEITFLKHFQILHSESE